MSSGSPNKTKIRVRPKIMKHAPVALLIAIPILLLVMCSIMKAQGKPLVVADFNEPNNISNVGTEFGTWNKDPKDTTQGCRMTFVKDDAMGEKSGMSVRLEYDVDSPNAAYNGFWLKLDGVKTSNYKAISFYVRGDAAFGFTTTVKVEIKDNSGAKISYTVGNISYKWQKIMLPLKTGTSIRSTLSEFTIVFDDMNSRPKRGAIMIDQIEISN